MKSASTALLLCGLVMALAGHTAARGLQSTASNNLFFPQIKITKTTTEPAAPPAPTPAPAPAPTPAPTPAPEPLGITSDDPTAVPLQGRVAAYNNVIKPFLVCKDVDQYHDECFTKHIVQICKKVKTTTQACSYEDCSYSPGGGAGSCVKVSGVGKNTVTIKVYYHVIMGSDGKALGNPALSSDKILQDQTEALNQLFAPAGFRFVMQTPVDRSLVGQQWFKFNGEKDRTQMDMFASKRQGSFKDLNVFIVDFKGVSFGQFPHLSLYPRGVAGLPAAFEGHTACHDMIVLDHSGLPTAKLAIPPEDIRAETGSTLTHEVGHWLELFHVFHDDSTKLGNEDAVRANLATLCTEYDESKSGSWLPLVVQGFGAAPGGPIELDTPIQPAWHKGKHLYAHEGFLSFPSNRRKVQAAEDAMYKSLGCGGHPITYTPSAQTCRAAAQRGPDNYRNIMDYAPPGCQISFTERQITVMHAAFNVRSYVAANGAVAKDKYPDMAIGREACLTGR